MAVNNIIIYIYIYEHHLLNQSCMSWIISLIYKKTLWLQYSTGQTFGWLSLAAQDLGTTPEQTSVCRGETKAQGQGGKGKEGHGESHNLQDQWEKICDGPLVVFFVMLSKVLPFKHKALKYFISWVTINVFVGWCCWIFLLKDVVTIWLHSAI